ncbi:MAG TPA: hypothetical protein VM510_09885 [Caulifigura sp.]|nr:hypothetical protein [Caulifigura sp.]
MIQLRLLSRSLGFALLVSIGTAPGCSSYSAVSEYEQLQQMKKSFGELVAAAGGSAEEKSFAVGGQSGKAWVLKLPGGKISDELIEEFGKLTYVAELDLSKSNITDAQLLKLDELKVCKTVMDLNLSDTAISDASFAKLKNLHCLAKANLKGTKVTSKGIDEFRKAYLAHPNTVAIFKKPKFEI